MSSERPQSGRESRPNAEALSAIEVLKTPDVEIGVFGTGKGLAMPIHFSTLPPALEEGRRVISLAHISPHSAQTPSSLDGILDRRGAAERTRMKEAFSQEGLCQEHFRNGNKTYVALYVPSRDAANREGYKGVFVAWDARDAAAASLSATFLESGSARDTMLELWRGLLTQVVHTASPHNRETATAEFFSPPSW